MAKLVLSDIENVLTSKNTLNANFAAIEQELQNRVLYRDNPAGEPNVLTHDLDLDGNDLLNVGALDASSITINGTSIAVPTEYVTVAQLNQVIAELLAILPDSFYTVE